jgi:hypothetical protein
MLFFLPGCAIKNPYVKEGKQYCITKGIFKLASWKYYERGVSCSEGGFYREAIKDFETAIEKREDDQRRIRTYGMHFTDYFPHREKGIAHYKLQQYKKAIDELEISLGMVESAKSKFYLKKAKRAFPEKRELDRLPPTLKINAPLDSSITNRFTITLSGVAEDDYSLSDIIVMINNVSLPFEISGKYFPFEKEVNLDEGVNKVRIVVHDLTGKKAEESLTINVDRQGPVIAIEKHHHLDRAVVISGYVNDNMAIKYFAIDGKKIYNDYSKELPLPFIQQVEVSEEKDIILLEAKDRAGNVTRAELKISSKTSSLPDWHMVASLGNTRFDMAKYENLSVIEEKTLFALRKDTSEPVIEFTNVADRQTLYDETINISIQVKDKHKLSYLSVNGKEEYMRQSHQRGILAASYRIKLSLGENKIVARASDIYSNEVKEISIIVFLREIGGGMSVGISYDDIIDDNPDIELNITKEVFNELLSSLNKTKRFSLFESVDASKIEASIRVSINELKDSINIHTRLLDAESKKLMIDNDLFVNFNEYKCEVNSESVKDIDAKKSIDVNKYIDTTKCVNISECINKICIESLAESIALAIPIKEGHIIEYVSTNKIMVNLGSENNIRPSMRLIIFRDDITIEDQEAGKLRTKVQKLGSAKIEHDGVRKNKSKAIITDKIVKIIKRGDKVITK